MPRIGVIGGSGLYSMPGFTEHNEVSMETPYGKPSDNYIVGQLEGKIWHMSGDIRKLPRLRFIVMTGGEQQAGREEDREGGQAGEARQLHAKIPW